MKLELTFVTEIAEKEIEIQIELKFVYVKSRNKKFIHKILRSIHNKI